MSKAVTTYCGIHRWPLARVVVPVHRGDLPIGTLRSIKQAGLTVKEFLDLL